jgi:16S rRNA C967 or C1407 C5-methylase (RsmB/RsmF family)
MLQHAADLVAPGGNLYATCRGEPEEEAIADAFRRRRPFHADAREAAAAVPPSVVDPRGHLRTRPDLHELDAFFAAVFARRHL